MSQRLDIRLNNLACRAYFKQSLPLHRMPTISDRTFFRIIFPLLKFLSTIFVPTLQLQNVFLTTFFSHSVKNSPKGNCTLQFLMTFSPSSLEMLRFSILFTYKITTTTAQFTFYNC